MKKRVVAIICVLAFGLSMLMGSVTTAWAADAPAATGADEGLSALGDTAPVAPPIDAACKIGTEPYASLEAAIAAVPDGTATTITLLTSTYSGGLNLVNKNITFDMSSFNLDISGNDYGLWLTDSTVNKTGEGSLTVYGANTGIYGAGTSAATVTTVTSGGTGVYPSSYCDLTVTGDVTGDSWGIHYDATNPALKVYGNVTSINGPGIFAAANGDLCSVYISGNLSGGAGGVRAEYGANVITIDGTISAGSGDYIECSWKTFSQADGVPSTAKAGYLEYANGGDVVYVKGDAVPATPTTLTDTNGSGITVTGSFTGDPVLTVTVIGDSDPSGDAIRQAAKDGTLLALYDIEITGGTYSGPLTVRIPVPVQYDGYYATIYHDTGSGVENSTSRVYVDTSVVPSVAYVTVVLNSLSPVGVSVTDPVVPVAPAITTGSLPNGTVGTAYNQTLIATGDTPITWSMIAEGTMPPGLSLDSETGVIFGTPTTAGTYNFTVQADNGVAPNATKALSIIISPAASGISAAAQAVIDQINALPNPVATTADADKAAAAAAAYDALPAADKALVPQAVKDRLAAAQAQAAALGKSTPPQPKAAPVTAIRSAQTTFYVVKGKSLTIPYAYDLAAGAASTAQPVFTWTSDNNSNVSVTAAGQVKGLAAGKSAKITVTADNGQSKTFIVKVVKAALKATGVSVSKPPKTMTVGAEKILKVKISPAKATGVVVTFSLDKASAKVVKVDKAGKVTAIAKGTAKITVKAGGQKTVVTIKVK